MPKFGVPIYFYTYVEVEAKDEAEAEEIADSMCIHIEAKLDNTELLEVFFDEVGTAEEI